MPLPAVAERLGLEELWVKRDDSSAPGFAGNKPRKLEWTLGEARRRGARAVLTFGYSGSNHATATSVHAARLGLRTVAALLPQPNATYVRRNLLAHAAQGAELHEYPGRRAIYAGAVARFARECARSRSRPAVIPAGGSSPLGTAGFVDAGFELAGQVAAGDLPEPDVLYVAVGSMGTAAGLAVGFAAAGLRTQVVGVRVVDTRWADARRLDRLAERTARLLKSWDSRFPIRANRAVLRHEFFGGGYAAFTAPGAEAARLVAAHGDLRLDGTYTAKAFAALVADARGGRLHGRRALFWHTATGARPEVPVAAGAALPPRLRRYLEEPVQPLDEAFGA